MALGVLVQTAPTGRQIQHHGRCVQPQPVEIDNVEAGLAARCDETPIEQPNGLGGPAAQGVDDPGQRQALTSTVARPMGEHERRLVRIADAAAVRAAVAESEHRAGVGHHVPATVERAAAIVRRGQVQQPASVSLQQERRTREPQLT